MRFVDAPRLTIGRSTATGFAGTCLKRLVIKLELDFLAEMRGSVIRRV